MAEEKKGNGKALVKISPEQEVRLNLARMEPQFRMVLPPHVPVERFARVMMTAVQDDPNLLQANRASLYSAGMKCAQDGLLPDKREAVLTVFKGQVVYMPMVGGILKKIRNSGELSTINAQVVYEHDKFEYELGDNERILHQPLLDGERGKPKLTYAIAKTKDGGIYREIMTESQIADVRKMSKAGDSGPWGGAFADEMRRKTVIRRLSKRLPMSTDLEQVIRRDDDLYDLEQQPGKPAAGAPGKRSRLSKVVEGAASPAQSAAEPQDATVVKENSEEPPI